MEKSRLEMLTRLYPEIVQNDKKLGREPCSELDFMKGSYKEEISFCVKAFKKSKYTKGERQISIKSSNLDHTLQFPIIPIPQKSVHSTVNKSVKQINFEQVKEEKPGFLSFFTCCFPKAKEIKPVFVQEKTENSPLKVVKVKKKPKYQETTEFDSAKPTNKGYTSDDERTKQLSENEFTETLDFFKANTVCNIHVSCDISIPLNALLKKGNDVVVLLLSNAKANNAFKKDKTNFHYLTRSNVHSILSSKGISLPIRKHGNLYSTNFTLIGRLNHSSQVENIAKPLKSACILGQFFSDYIWSEGEDTSKLNRMVLEDSFYLADWYQHNTILLDLGVTDSDSGEIRLLLAEILDVVTKKQFKSLKNIEFHCSFYDELVAGFVQELNRTIEGIKIKPIFYS